MLINLRNALMARKRLPYDAEVEYLESSGTQYIDTGVVWESVTTAKTEATIQYTQTSGRQITCGASTAFYFGCNANRWEYAYRLYTGTVGADVTTVAKEVTSEGMRFYINGSLAATLTQSASREWWGGTAYVFGLNNGGSFVLPSTARLYSLKIWIGDSLVFDGIPVRKGTTGELYDRVSGKFAERHGDFVLGQDVVPVEWLGSDGNQYIDTGVVPNDMTGFRVDAMARGSNDNVRVLGVYETISGQMQRFAAVLRSAGSHSQEYYFGWGAAYDFIAGESNFNKRRSMELNYLNSRKMTFDGAIVQSNLPTLPTFTTSAYLFGNRNATPRIAMRCYQCQMSEGSSLSRSYYPVRVGTEGAMIDTLTRRIYRNQGTGAFGYGNDLRYPIPAS